MPNLMTKYSLKVASAITLVALVSPYFNLQRSYWIIITAIVIMLPTVGATLERSKMRGINTATGVIIGALLAYVINNHFIYVALCVAPLVFFACYYAQTHYARTVFCVSVMVVLLLSQLANHPFEFAFWRFVDTIIGIVIAFVFSIFVFPCWSKKSILKSVHTTLNHVSMLSSTVLNTEKNTIDLSEIMRIRLALVQSIGKVQKEFNEMKHEMNTNDKRIALMDAIILMLERLRFDLYLLMDTEKHPIATINIVIIQDYANKVLAETMDSISTKSNMEVLPIPAYQPSEDPYMTQVIKNYIQNLSALAQNIAYYLA